MPPSQPPSTPRSRKLPPGTLQWIAGGAGGAALVTGAVAVFTSGNEAGTTALLTVGALLLLVGMFGHLVDSFEFNGTRVNLRKAAEAVASARRAELDGDRDEAARLREQAVAILEEDARAHATEYRQLRTDLPRGRERTQVLEQLMDEARRTAATLQATPEQVAAWLRGDDEGERVTALAAMRQRPDLRDPEAVLAAVADPRSAFEHYHAMKLAADMAGDLGPDQRRRLAATVEAQRGLRYRATSDRWRMSEQVLREVAAADG
ncbi:hypothetical protein [Marinitenerispora sediminis]|uniref:Uncharacterized protein n=1 Tax=Marinitenerispora sediminis TaxID=1931232 RepID=A0A368T806_9ACTN|nr:hypothetical protein [Marinitenerispora sediminis]RCV52038.1 hypothetical protein DEF23_19410 [Marinitenerispora sediminis]RCV54693.1 hypothetical protein DEF28_07670 [Marinitenerispora sediminis]RCV60381.1 hypothetical protein DEF24_07220 [Marinitenerispora sediminis]